MNREKLYRTIGNIDDELILEAHDAYERQRGKMLMYRIICAAACLCLICGSVLFGLMRDAVYINRTSLPPFAKRVEANIENAAEIVLSREEMLVYYGIEPMDGVFGENMVITEPSRFVLWRDESGSVVYDENTLYYSSHDHTDVLSVILSKLGEDSDLSKKGLKLSRIDGVSVLLASWVNAEQVTCRAEFDTKSLFVQMNCSGLSEDEFVQAIRQMIEHIKASE